MPTGDDTLTRVRCATPGISRRRAPYIDPRVIDRFTNGETIRLPERGDPSDDRVRARVEAEGRDRLGEPEASGRSA